MNGVYKGFNLISQETDSMLKDADCPQTEDYNEEDYADSENDSKPSIAAGEILQTFW